MSWTCLSDRRLKARKPHRCYLCGLKIAVGETYVRYVGVGEDGFSSSANHDECLQVTSDNKWDIHCWESHDSECFREELAEWREARKATP